MVVAENADTRSVCGILTAVDKISTHTVSCGSQR